MEIASLQSENTDDLPATWREHHARLHRPGGVCVRGLQIQEAIPVICLCATTPDALLPGTSDLHIHLLPIIVSLLKQEEVFVP